MVNQEEWITVQEAANRFGVSPETIRWWIRNKKISSQVRGLGRGYRVNPEEIERLRQFRGTGEHEAFHDDP